MTTETGTIPDSAEVADRLAIQDVLNMHSRGLDRLEEEAIKSAYWPDAEVDYGSYKGNAHVFAELVIGALGQQYELTRHALGNVLVAITDGRAWCETCVHAGHLLPGGAEELLFYGRYLDRLDKRGQQWKISHRQVVMDWSKRHPVQDERDSAAFGDLAKGAHFDSDPLYPFLNQRHTAGASQ